ncbi:hypothetical protein O0544_13180 [Edwardsiella anguillarum]|nr:hypothetical protein [Edwardsiella anguillarum]
MVSICLISPRLAPIGPPTLKPTLLERLLVVLLLWVWLLLLQLLWRVRVTPLSLNTLSSLWVQLPETAYGYRRSYGCGCRCATRYTVRRGR